MSNLTSKQLETLVFIKTYYDATGTVPTLATIGKKFGISAQAAFYRFRGLVTRGYVKTEPNIKQGYEVIK